MDDTKVGLVYGPFYLAGQITVDSHLGVPAGTAKDPDTYQVKLSSGINYPDLVASRLS